MATKPTLPTNIFCTQNTYTSLTAEPGLVGTSTKVNGGGTFRGQGAKPGEGTPAQHINFDFHVWSSYVDWVAKGSSSGAADAHVVETNSIGSTSIKEGIFGSFSSAPGASQTLLVQGQGEAGDRTMLIRDNGDSPTLPCLDVQAAQDRTAAVFLTDTLANNSAYGFYPTVRVESLTTGVLTHHGDLPAGAVDFYLGDTPALFAALTDEGQVGLHVQSLSDQPAALLERPPGVAPTDYELKVVSNVGNSGLMRLQGSGAQAVTSDTEMVKITSGGNASDTGRKLILDVDAVNMRGSRFRASELGLGSSLEPNCSIAVKLDPRSDDYTHPGSASLYACKPPFGGSAIRVRSPDTYNTPGLPWDAMTSDIDPGQEVRIFSDDNWALSMSPNFQGSLTAGRVGFGSQQSADGVRHLVTARGSVAEGYDYEYVQLSKVRHLRFVEAQSNTDTNVLFPFGTTFLHTINSASANGPSTNSPYAPGARLFIKVTISGQITSTNGDVNLAVSDDTLNSTIYSEKISSTNNGDYFSGVASFIYTVPAGGHRAFTAIAQLDDPPSNSPAPSAIIHSSSFEIETI